MRRTTIAASLLPAVLLAACSANPTGSATGSGSSAATGGAATKGASASTAALRGCPLPEFGPGAAYHPRFRPDDFSPDVTNPWFPLTVGRTLIYSGIKDGKTALNIATTTNRTRTIAGVTTRVVEDRLYLDNVLEERTSDYYTQDRCGNVWYFGEDTATVDAKGKVVSTDGTFHVGVDGAAAGVFMQAQPQPGHRFRQEWSPGHAEDTFQVLDLAAPVQVPYRSVRDALRTEERTDLEPDVVDNKYYVSGVGEVFEGALKGPRETLRLVEIIS